uniref:Glycosyltransferase family 92 protein n=1 Tax=Caenorhabditis japonica TaxID=281687 RepID=A0A8R1HHS7_CAEJA
MKTRNSAHLFTWSTEIDNLGGISLTAEHRKSPKLEEHTERPALEIFPQEPYSNPHDVVTCYSPIFEDYEMVLSSLTTSIAMGAFVHLPYEELSGELYKFLKVFEKSGHLRLSANPLLRHPPRIGSPLKIQALKTDLAHLNCHLMYRSSAKFMIFQNSDDIVLPILPGGNYLSEFSTIFQAPRVKGYSILEYNAQVSVDDVSHGEFADFSVRKAMDTVRIQAKGKDGESKALVMKMTPPTENDSKTQIVVDLGVLARFSVESEQSTTALNTAHAKMYTSRNLKIFPKIQENIFQKINEIIDKMEGVDEFWTLLKSCQFDAKRSTWKCSSEKCIRPRIRHRSLHGWYSYDIHFSLFARVDSFDC